jgi:protein Mpv17
MSALQVEPQPRKRRSRKTLIPPPEQPRRLPWDEQLSNAIINEALLLSVLAITAYSIFTIDSSFWRGWYPNEILLRIPVDNWRAYEGAVSADPVPIKAALTGATYFVGDWLAQTLELKQKARSWRDADRPRIAKNALVGLLLLGPLAHFYYDFVTDCLDGWPIPAKIALDQTVYLGLYNTLYCVALGALGGRGWEDIVEEARTTFIPLITAGWKLWPLVGIVTYTLIPPEHRVLWIDAIEVFYSVILSTIANANQTNKTTK